MKCLFQSILLVVMSIFLMACAMSFKIPPEDANYGLEPDNYKWAIKNYFEGKLYFSEYTTYTFGKPIKAYENQGLAWGGGVRWLGYVVDVQVNTTDVYGEPTEKIKYVFSFNANSIYRVNKNKDGLTVHRVN